MKFGTAQGLLTMNIPYTFFNEGHDDPFDCWLHPSFQGGVFYNTALRV